MTKQMEKPEAEAKAAAEAEAAAAAAAEAEAKAKAEAEAKAKAKPKLSEEALRAALTVIEARNTDLHRKDLVAELAQIKGAKIEDAGNTYRVRLHGLEVTNTAGLSQALTVWCSKARRAILNGEAE